MTEAKRIIDAKYIVIYVCFFLFAVFAFLKEQYNDADYYQAASDYSSYTKWEILRITGQEYEKYLEKLNNGEDIYTENNENILEAEQQLNVEKCIENSVLYELKSQTDYMERYKDKYNDMKKYVEGTSAISIFNTENSFSKRNSDKTIEAFKGIDNIELQYGNNIWVKSLTEYNFADYLLLILIIYMIMQFGIEQKSNLIYFVRATEGGRGRLAASRCVLLIVFVITSVLFFYGGILITSGIVHNVKYNFSRSIQSIALFENCIFKINVGQFLILFFIIKCILFIFLAFFIWNMLGGIREKKFGMISLGIFFAAEYIMYVFIGDNSRINHLKYINIFYYLDTGRLIGGYKNINVFSYPANTFRIFMFLVPIMIVILGAVCIYKNSYSYGNKGNVIIKAKKFMEKVRIKVSPVIDKTGAFRGEAMKLFIIMGGAVIAGIFIYAGYTRIDNKPLSKSQEGKIKEFYYNEIGGMYSEDMPGKADKLIFDIESEYNGIMESLYTLSEEERIMYLMKADGLESKLSVLNSIRNDIIYLQELKNEKGITGKLYNPDGVNYLFGDVSRDSSIINAIIICSFICLFSGGVYAYERKSNMLQFVDSTLNGRGKTKIIKLFWCMLSSAIYTGLISAVEYINVTGKVGIDGLSGAVQSIRWFKEFPFEISLGSFIIFVYAMRILWVISITAVVVCISKYMSKIITGQLISFIVICMPLILYYIGINILKYAALGRGVAASDFIMNNGRWDNSVFVKSALIVMLGSFAVYIYMKDNKRKIFN